MATASTTSNRQVSSGNKISVEINGKSVGLIKSIRCSDSYGLTEATGIGDINVQEWVPTVARHSLSVQSMVLFKNSLLQEGVTLKHGDEALLGVVFSIVINDKDMNGTRTYFGCSYDSGELDISANQITSASCQFKALGVTNANDFRMNS